MKSILHGRLILGLLFLFLALGSFADGRYIPVYDDGIRVDYKHYCLGFNKEHRQGVLRVGSYELDRESEPEE